MKPKFRKTKLADPKAGTNYALVAENMVADFYLAQLPGPAADPARHYLESGWKEGYDPHPDFSTDFYLARSPDVRKAGMNPYLHYLEWGRAEGRAANPDEAAEKLPQQETDPDLRLLRLHFDREFYLSQVPHVGECHADPVLHYHLFGWKSGHDPSPRFAVAHYLARNADVRKTGIDPFLHYLKWGRHEGRSPHPDDATWRYWRGRIQTDRDLIVEYFDTDFYAAQVPDLGANDADPLQHYLSFGWLQDLDPSPDFSTAFYRATHDQEQFKGKSPLIHYVQTGRDEGSIPRPVHPVLNVESTAQRLKQQKRLLADHFDADFYNAMSSELPELGIDPLQHYLLYGWREDRDPAPWFSTRFYRRSYPQHENYRLDPLSHYLIWGRSRGFRTHPDMAPAHRTNGARGGSAVKDLMLRCAVAERPASGVSPDTSYNPERLDIHWVVPAFGVGGGGHMTIFRTIQLLEFLGHKCTIWLNSEDPVEPDKTYDNVLKQYRFVKAEIHEVSDALLETRGDALVATSWDTAFVVDAAKGFKDRFYFVQDYEPFFYARGSRNVMAEATYDLDLACICASPWLRHLLETRHDRWARHFYLSYERDLYYPAAQSGHDNTARPGGVNKVPRIALYGRIGTERRCVELALLALERLAQRGVGFHVDIFGTDHQFSDFQFPSTFHGILSGRELGELYRQCDLGLCFSATNYSLVPQEMMACGLPVIELDVESVRGSIAADAVHLTPPLPGKIADAIEFLLKNDEKRLEQARRGQEWSEKYTWEGAARSVEAALKERLEEGAWTAKPAAAPAVSAAAPPRASIIVPVLNGGKIWGEVLERIAQQKTDFAFELVVIDSGSTDGSVAQSRKHPFATVIEIPKSEFQHGRTRNFAAAQSKGELLVFITQDAVPADPLWLYNFVSAMEQFPEAAGAFGKHYAHKGASAFTVHELRNHFAGFEKFPLLLSKHTDIAKWNVRDRGWMQLLHFYSDNNSCMRRSAWEKLPYPEVAYGEDQLWAMEAIRRGWGKLYCPNAAVYHSHDYDYAQMQERAETEARFFYKYFGYDLSVRDVDEQIARRNAAAERFAAQRGLPRHETDQRKRTQLAQLVGWSLGRNKAEMEE